MIYCERERTNGPLPLRIFKLVSYKFYGRSYLQWNIWKLIASKGIFHHTNFNTWHLVHHNVQVTQAISFLLCCNFQDSLSRSILIFCQFPVTHLRFYLVIQSCCPSFNFQYTSLLFSSTYTHSPILCTKDKISIICKNKFFNSEVNGHLTC